MRYAPGAAKHTTTQQYLLGRADSRLVCRCADPPFTGASDINNTVAAFMLIRGPHAYLGWSWVSCSGDCFSKTCPAPPGNQIHYDVTLGGLTETDYGEPTEVCHETAAGSNVFVREWTKATVTLNCSDWSSSIKPK